MKKILCILVTSLLLLWGCGSIETNAFRVETIDGQYKGKITVPDHLQVPLADTVRMNPKVWNMDWKSLEQAEPQLMEKHHWRTHTEETKIKKYSKLRYFHEAVMEAAHANLVIGRNVTLITAINERGEEDNTIGQALVYYYYKDVKKNPKVMGVQTIIMTNHPDRNMAFTYQNVMEVIEDGDKLSIVRENIPVEEALNKHRAYITWKSTGKTSLGEDYLPVPTK